MSRSAQRDFTTGSIPRHLLLFSVPMLLGNVLQVLQNTIDSIWVGRYVGAEALGTVSISFPLIFAMISMVAGITMASSILVSQYRGAGDEAMVQRTITTSFSILTLGGVIVTAAGILLRYPLLELIQTPAEILDDSATYFGIFMAGTIPMFLYFTISAILRGLGDSKTPLKFMAIATFLNIVLDPLMILGVGPFPKMGVAGAALATTLAQCVASGLLLRWVLKNSSSFRFDSSFWRWDMSLVKTILKIGIPAGLQQVLVSFSMVSVTTIINTFGSNTVAAYGAASRLDSMAFMPSMSMGMAVSALVGQNVGAGKFDRVTAIVRWSNGMAAAVTGLVGLLAITNPTILMKLFTSDAAVLAEGSRYLQVMGFVYVPMALTFTLGGVMRGAGDTMSAMVFTIISLWVFRVPLAYYLSRSLGSQGIWYGIAISSAAGLIIQYLYYLTGRWKRQVVKKGPMASVPAVQTGD